MVRRLAAGTAVFELIEAEPHRLREVTGIGPRRVLLQLFGAAMAR
jgi:hypothetical protein